MLSGFWPFHISDTMNPSDVGQEVRISGFGGNVLDGSGSLRIRLDEPSGLSNRLLDLMFAASFR